MPVLEQNNFYAIDRPDGKPRNRYPIGASLLAMPYVVAAALIHPSLENEIKTSVPARLEMTIASIFGAISGCLFFLLIFGQFESVPIALVATTIFAFGTSMWSTATRALWQHGPLVMMLLIAMLLLARSRQRANLIQFVSLPLAMACLTRPTAVVPVLVISVYVLIFHRKWFLRYLGWATLIALPWILYNVAIYHALVPPYYHSSAFSPTSSFGQGLAGNLFSPSRGLFVFSPVLIFAFSGFLLALRDREQRPLNIAYAAIIVGHSVIVGEASMWWAGHSFGPRFMTDIVPFLGYFVAFNFRPPEWVSPIARSALFAFIGVFALISVVINAQGALRSAVWSWNVIPQNIDDQPSRAWDWRDPQFARRKGDYAPPDVGKDVTDRPAVDAPGSLRN